MYGIELPEPVSKWSKAYVVNLSRLQFNNRWMQESSRQLLEDYVFLSQQILEQTKLVRELAETELYRDRVKIFRNYPGIGLLAAMELLLELQDVARFRRTEDLAAYVGLTPAQYSSADKIRMGRITAIGKNGLRGTLVEVAWRVVGKGPGMRRTYERIKARSGSKRAIVAIARRVLLTSRRMLLENRPYQYRMAA